MTSEDKTEQRTSEAQPDPATPHLIDGEFQSDKYPTCPRGKVPLSVKDPTAQDLLWEYAQRRRAVDREFAADLETALRFKGFAPRTNEARPGGGALATYPQATPDLDWTNGKTDEERANDFIAQMNSHGARFHERLVAMLTEARADERRKQFK